MDIVRELPVDNRIQRMLLNNMAKIYEENLPDSLYLNQYQLAENFGYTHQDWNKFLKLKEVDRLIESEIAQIAEIGARHALANLLKGQTNSADIQAAKELLSNSKLLQQKHNQRPQVVITRIPPKRVS